MVHFVYFLAASLDGPVIYVGRSLDPNKRLYNFKWRNNLPLTVLKSTVAYKTLEEAQEAEKVAIRNLQPIHNLRVVSSSGRLGQPISAATKIKQSEIIKRVWQQEGYKAKMAVAMSKAMTGRVFTEAHKKALRKPKSEEGRAAMRGRVRSEEHKQALRKSKSEVTKSRMRHPKSDAGKKAIGEAHRLRTHTTMLWAFGVSIGQKNG